MRTVETSESVMIDRDDVGIRDVIIPESISFFLNVIGFMKGIKR